MKIRFLFLLLLLILLHTSLHLYSTKNANFYFTVDEGRDALEVREILVRKNFPKMGPRTGAIENLFVGPFWYFIIAPGYLLSNGDPWGAVLVMILVNSLTLMIVFKFSRKYLDDKFAFLVSFNLCILERFWFSSQFALNPQILPFLTISLVILLTGAYVGHWGYLLFAGIVTGLFVHSELAFIPVAFTAYFSALAYFLIKRNCPRKKIVKSLILFLLLLIPHIYSEITNNFSQIKAVIRAINEPAGIIGKQTFIEKLLDIIKQYINLFGKTFIPQSAILGIIVFIFITFLIFLRISQKKYPKSFNFAFFLTFLMLVFSLFWFSTNKEFVPWHILGLYPLVFIIWMIGLILVKKKYATILFLVITVFQLGYFVRTYPPQLKAGDDSGLFINQLNAVDWIYQESQQQGFKVYTYLQFVYDFPYQYSIWWRGTKQYGFLPCEYSTYPNTPSSLYFSAIQYYQKPTKTCTNLRFLIIEPTKDNSGFGSWYKGVTKNTELLTTRNFGKIIVEKRKTLNQ